MKTQRQKHDYEAMEPSKKRTLLQKKKVRDLTNKHELKMNKITKVQNNGPYYETSSAE